MPGPPIRSTSGVLVANPIKLNPLHTGSFAVRPVQLSRPLIPRRRRY